MRKSLRETHCSLVLLVVMSLALVSLLGVVPISHAQTVVATVNVGSGPQGIAYDSGKGEVFVANNYANAVSVISDTNDSVVATVNVGSGPYGVTYDSGRGEVFVANNYDNTVSVISDTSDTVVATVNVGSGPHGIAYDSGRGEVFVSNDGSTTVSIISDTSDTVVATVNVGASPCGVAYDSGKGEVFVANYDDSTVSVISDTSDTVVATVNVGSDPWGLAYDSSSGEVFASNNGSNTVSVIFDGTRSSSTSVDCSVSSIYTRSSTTCTATITGFSPTGTVSFTQSGTGTVTFSSASTCTLVSGSCSLTVTGASAGSVTIQAAYGGDSNNLGSSGTFGLTVTILIVSQPVQIEVAEGAQAAIVTLSGCSVSPASITANGAAQTVRAASSCTITASLPSTDNTRYESSAGTSSLPIPTCTSPGTCPTYSAVIFYQLSEQFAYAVVNGGTGYSAPTLSFTSLGSASTYLETIALTPEWLDYGSTWSTTNPLGGSGTGERWQTASGTSGATSAGASVTTSYYHQFLYTLSYSVVGGEPSTPPTLTSTQFGAAYASPLSTTPTGYWLDDLATCSTTNPLSGSTRTEGWITATSCPTVEGSLTIVFAYDYYQLPSTSTTLASSGSVSATATVSSGSTVSTSFTASSSATSSTSPSSITSSSIITISPTVSSGSIVSTSFTASSLATSTISNSSQQQSSTPSSTSAPLMTSTSSSRSTTTSGSGSGSWPYLLVGALIVLILIAAWVVLMSRQRRKKGRYES